MKKSIKLICILLVAHLLTNKMKAQAMTDSVSVIISPGTTDSKTIDDVKTSIKSLNGIRFVGYCANHNVYLFYIDKKVHGSVTDFYNNLKVITNVSTLDLKRGTVDKLLPLCSFSDPTDAARVKAR